MSKIRSKSGWRVKSGAFTMKKKLNDSILGIEKLDITNNIIATGTKKELEIIKRNYNKALLPKNTRLVITGNKLKIYRNVVKHKELVKKMNENAVDVITKNREVIKSELTNEELAKLLGQLLDHKAMGREFDLEDEMLKIKGITKLPLVRQTAETLPVEPHVEDSVKGNSPNEVVARDVPNNRNKTKRSKFRVMKAPSALDTETEANETEYPASESETDW
jgi:hypothetical protein